MSKRADRSNQPANRLDLDEATRLVDALEQDLARLRQGSADIDKLRAEVEQLRTVLGADRPDDLHHGQVRESLHGVRALLHDVGDELAADAVKASDYVMRIGRLLGL